MQNYPRRLALDKVVVNVQHVSKQRWYWSRGRLLGPPPRHLTSAVVKR